MISNNSVTSRFFDGFKTYLVLLFGTLLFFSFHFFFSQKVSAATPPPKGYITLTKSVDPGPTVKTYSNWSDQGSGAPTRTTPKPLGIHTVGVDQAPAGYTYNGLTAQYDRSCQGHNGTESTSARSYDVRVCEDATVIVTFKFTKSTVTGTVVLTKNVDPGTGVRTFITLANSGTQATRTVTLVEGIYGNGGAAVDAPPTGFTYDGLQVRYSATCGGWGAGSGPSSSNQNIDIRVCGGVTATVTFKFTKLSNNLPANYFQNNNNNVPAFIVNSVAARTSKDCTYGTSNTTLHDQPTWISVAGSYTNVGPVTLPPSTSSLDLWANGVGIVCDGSSYSNVKQNGAINNQSIVKNQFNFKNPIATSTPSITGLKVNGFNGSVLSIDRSAQYGATPGLRYAKNGDNPSNFPFSITGLQNANPNTAYEITIKADVVRTAQTRTGFLCVNPAGIPTSGLDGGTNCKSVELYFKIRINGGQPPCTPECCDEVCEPTENPQSNLCEARSATNPIRIKRGETASLEWNIKNESASQGSGPQYVYVFGSTDQYKAGALGSRGDSAEVQTSGSLVPNSYDSEVPFGTYPDQYYLVNGYIPRNKSGPPFKNRAILWSQPFSRKTRIDVKPDSTTTFGLWQLNTDDRYPGDAQLAARHKQYISGSNANYNTNMATLKATLDRLQAQKNKSDMSTQDLEDLETAYNTNWFAAAEWDQVGPAGSSVESQSLFRLPIEVVVTLTDAEKVIVNSSGFASANKTLTDLISGLRKNSNNTNGTDRQQVFSKYFNELTDPLYAWYDTMEAAKTTESGLSEYDLLMKYRGNVLADVCPITVIIEEPSNNPYLKVDGSDVISGASFDSLGCTPTLEARSAAIKTNGYLQDKDSQGFSGSQYATYASGVINGLDPGSFLGNNGYLRGSNEYRDLLFANSESGGEIGNAGEYYGQSGAGSGLPCVKVDAAKLEKEAEAAGRPVISAANPSAAAVVQAIIASGKGPVVVNGNLTLNAVSGISSQKTLVVNGDLTLNGNLTYQTQAGSANLPFLKIIAHNIYINPGVSQLDPQLVAYPQMADNGNLVDGTVDTCTVDGTGVWPSQYVINSCKRKLQLNGSLTARRILWKGTYGTVGVTDGVVDTTCLYASLPRGSDCAAEYINFRPANYISRFINPTSPTTGKPVSSVELPPIY